MDEPTSTPNRSKDDETELNRRRHRNKNYSAGLPKEKSTIQYGSNVPPRVRDRGRNYAQGSQSHQPSTHQGAIKKFRQPSNGSGNGNAQRHGEYGQPPMGTFLQDDNFHSNVRQRSQSHQPSTHQGSTKNRHQHFNGNRNGNAQSHGQYGQPPISTFSQDNNFHNNVRQKPTNQRHASYSPGNKPEPVRGYQRNNNRNAHDRLNKTASSSSTPTKKPHIGFKYLEQLLAMDDEGFATKLSSQHAGLSDLMQTELSRDVMVLTVRVIRKAANSMLDHSRVVILQAALVNGFTQNLEKYVGLLPMQDEQQKRMNRYFWNNPDDFWAALLEICTLTLDILPTLAANVLPKILKVMKVYIPSIESQHNLSVAEGIKSRMEDLSKAVEDCNRKLEEEKLKKSPVKISDEEKPPNDFRTIDVLPSPSEVLGGRNFLRENILKGGYSDVDHYLDVQFRLLREDFVRPLRKGIQSYREDPKKRLENVKVYKKVRFLNAEIENNNYCMRIKFEWNNLKKLKSMNFENCKRFMFGSLLCFTKDSFKTIFFGRVVGRKKEDLERGQLIVGFDERLEMLNDIQTDFVMVECSVYFEPYYHVLKAMQAVQQDEFPMDKYIVFVNTDVDEPLYLTHGIRYTVGQAKLPVLEDWSARDVADAELGLNQNQLEAYKAALAQEFVIIQGPPGTGKTYLGLKIARTLIENKDVWHLDDSPMLVVCYTNHALDQFLEGMIPFTGGNMTRIGGQSNNETLKPYNLRSMRRFNLDGKKMKNNLANLMVDIKKASELLQKLQDWDCIMTFSIFQESSLMPLSSFFDEAPSSQLLDWLFNEVDKKEETTIVPLRDEGSANAFVEEDDGIIDSDVDEENDGLFESVLDDLHVPTSSVLIDQEMMEKEVGRLQQELDSFLNTDAGEMQKLLKNATLTESIRRWRNRSVYLQAKLQDLKQKDYLAVVRQPDDVDWKNPWSMAYASRWDLYLHLVQSVRPLLAEKLDRLNEEFRRLYAAYEEIQHVADVRVMRSKLVIGMTTTGAARQRKYLELLKCPIVIVEEAAEVLEAHIVASITAHCEHLILIGDHQQLQPSTADYKVKVKYGLGISLFERMVKNDFHCHTLTVQHRMRPEFSTLIRGSIYENLQDHESVFNRPKVAGVDHCLYFIDHQQMEQSLEGTSKKNVHEAAFLVALARYLVLNDHAAQKITILAAYLGQMFEINTRMRYYGDLLRGCRVSALDNYQGEENDLVLLSLVRSNVENKIGFLAQDNRVCVALSRAKHGFYLIGNMTQLCHESHRRHDGRPGVWSKIKTKFEEQNAIGPSLTLRCQIHDVVTPVKSADDFLRVPEGGCTKRCEMPLKCGHSCQSICHAWDRNHKEYRCRQVCMKNLCNRDDTHLCKNQCNQPCGPCRYPVFTKLECGHELDLECHMDKDTFECPVLVTTKLPCEHTVQKPCHRDPVTFRCPHPCDTTVEPCGHACLLRCHIRQDPDHLEYKCTKRCAKYMKGCTVKGSAVVKTDKHLCPLFCYQECPPCDIYVMKKRTVCPHAFNVPCHENVDEKICEKPCKKALNCGHKCNMKCSEPCGPCRNKVDKILELCGHVQKAVECHAKPDRSKCRLKCPLKLPCGHPCTVKCNEPCTRKCKEKVPLGRGISAACGHVINHIECHQSGMLLAADDQDLLRHCTEPCGVELKCGHPCAGSCGKCFQGRFHQRCSSECGVPLVCNHLCKNPCREACRSCTERCSNKCIHSGCKKRCGEVCTPCKEPCPRRCPHKRCSSVCGKSCLVTPCEEPCQQLLECGHACAGFCGDPCLSKCRECHPEFFEVFFGTEDEPEARFVQLRDCPHIVEDSGMMQWLEQASEEIAFKVCPVCKAPIRTTHRYSDYVKKAALDVMKVKKKLAGGLNENLAEAKSLIDQVNVAKTRAKDISIQKALEVLRVRLEPTRAGKRQAIDKVQLNAITSKLQLIERLIKATDGALEPAHAKHIEAILKVIATRDENYITDQEIDDAAREIDRLSKLIPFSKIDRADKSKVTTKIAGMLKRGDVLAYAPKVYTPEDDEEFAEILDQLKRVFAMTLIPKAERDEIVKAMGFAKGHWFKCPNGHVYAIDQCGGAMQKSKCYECGADIGGDSHQLLASNALASEMDGARYAAYSETANNLANWDLNAILH